MPPKVAAGLLWCILAAGALLIAVMVWHPWVVGSSAGCAPETTRAWDGRCYGNKSP